ncbi:MAG: Ribonuclease, partial [Pseudomonadota bacterium]
MKIYNSNFLSIGVDEVGRGAIAGPVVACASCLDYDSIPDGIKDSKRLSKTKRESLNDIFVDKTSKHFFAIGSASVDEIDEMNILNATMLAMQRAVANLIAEVKYSNPDLLKKVKMILIDGNKVPPNLPFAALSIVKGDDKYFEIASASIVAKVFRDKLMSDCSIEL